MAYLQIKTYQLWYKVPQHIGQLKVTLHNGAVIPFLELSAAEFASITKVLDNAPVFYDPDTGWFSTTEEVPQD